jgi:hypothetical protein
MKKKEVPYNPFWMAPCRVTVPKTPWWAALGRQIFRCMSKGKPSATNSQRGPTLSEMIKKNCRPHSFRVEGEAEAEG